MSTRFCARSSATPVEQPTKFELIMNLTVAKAHGLKLSEAFLLLRTDEVIERTLRGQGRCVREELTMSSM